MSTFLHLKFASGRPPPVAANIPWAHEVDPARDPLHETIKADTQREGLVRHLQQNFPAGSYVHDVVHEREGDPGMYILCTKNWARSVGDPKLHLSLYVYQEDSHCATWHAYADRSISYSREGDEADPPPDGADPYSTPDALAAAASRAPSPMPPPKDDDRPRFDRPAAAPDSDEEGVEEPFQPADVLAPRPAATAAARSRRFKKPEPVELGSETDEDQSSPRTTRERSDKPVQAREARAPEEDVEPVSTSAPAEQRSARSTRRRQPSLDDDSESAEPDVDLSKPAYPILKSKPLGRSSTRARQPSPTRSPSPPPPSRSSRSARRARTPSPEPPKRERPVSSSSPRRSPSPPAAPRSSRRDEPPGQDRERQRSRRRWPEKDESLSRSPSPAPSKPPTSRSSRKPRAASPEPASASPSRSISASPPPRSRRTAATMAGSGGAEQVKPVVDMGRRRARSPTRSPSPVPAAAAPPHASRSTRRERPRVDESDVEAAARRSRSASRSPPPPSRTSRRSRSSPPRSRRVHDDQAEDNEFAEPSPNHERSGRSSTRPPPPPPMPSAPPLDRTPSWRSVSRNRHRRDDSDDDTLVRGNMDDPELDVPAGGEVSLLETKRRSASKDRSARRPRARDQGFDPAVVAQPPATPAKQTAGALLGGWVKSVVALVKTEGELVAGEVKEKVLEVEEETEEARLKRKEERMQRRAVRAARRAARADAEAQIDAAEAGDARTQRKALERAEEKRKGQARDGKASGAATAPLGKAPDRETHSRATRPRASSRRRSPSRSASDSDVAPPPRPHRVEPAEPDLAQVRSSRHRHRGSSNVDSPSELDNEPDPPRPTPRQRAMSVSATVESGLRGLRDSVTKMVSGAHDVEHAVDGKVHHRETNSSRSKHETRRRRDEPDSDAERDQHGRSDRSRRPSIAVDTGGESRRAARQRETAVSPIVSPVVQRRPDRQRAPPSRLRDSDSSEGPPRRLARVAPQEPHSPRVDSDSAASELPSRPSSRLTVRSESEEDGPHHRLAKLNAVLNAVPPEPVQPPHSARLGLVSNSPAAAHGPRPHSPRRHHDRASRYDEPRPAAHGRRFLDELKDDVERLEHKVVAELPPHKLSHGARRRQRADDVLAPRHGDSVDPLEDRSRAAPRPPASDLRRPAVHVPAAERSSPSVPPIPSPMSPDAPNYPYAYDRSSLPIRPEPVKPSSYVAAPPHQKRIPPPSSVGSSDEGDLSRPMSGIGRTRSGHLTASGSEVDEGRSDRSSAFEPQYGHEATDSERETPASRAHQHDRRRYDRSPSRSPLPPQPKSSSMVNKRHSFSRTGGSYPFSGDESSDGLSASSSEGEDRGGGSSSRYGPSSAGGHSSRTRVSSAAPPRAAEPQPYRAPAAAGGGSRTMVSSPSTGSAPSRSTGRTIVSSAAASSPTSGPFRPQQQPYSSRDDDHSPYTDCDPRDAPSSYSAPFRPQLSPASPPSPAAYHRPQHSQLLSREGPSGFTGFDARGHRREVDDAEFERDERERERERRERGRLRQQGMASGSAKRFGEHGAPVGRRMANRLGL